MSQKDREIANILWGDGTGSEESHPIMTGVAQSYDEATMTCTVLLDVNDAATATSGVLLNGVSTNNNGLILLPTANSKVWVAELNGPGAWGIVKCSTIDKMTVKVGDSTMVIDGTGIVMNGGTLHGMVLLNPLVSKMNRLENLLMALIAKYNAHVHSGGTLAGALTGIPGVLETGTVIPITTAADLENVHVKQ